MTNTAHVHCMLVNKGYRHTFRIQNTYCLSTNTMVRQTHLDVTFMCTLPILLTVLRITNFYIISLCVATPMSVKSEHQRFGAKRCLQFQDKNLA